MGEDRGRPDHNKCFGDLRSGEGQFQRRERQSWACCRNAFARSLGSWPQLLFSSRTLGFICSCLSSSRFGGRSSATGREGGEREPRSNASQISLTTRSKTAVRSSNQVVGR